MSAATAHRSQKQAPINMIIFGAGLSHHSHKSTLPIRAGSQIEKVYCLAWKVRIPPFYSEREPPQLG